MTPRPELTHPHRSALGREADRLTSSACRPPPDLHELEDEAARYMGSDSLGLVRVIVGCTRAILAMLHRIERQLER